MPYKHNESKRHHFKKHTYRQTNYAEYNQSLRDRGVLISGCLMRLWRIGKPNNVSMMAQAHHQNTQIARSLRAII